MEKTNFDWIRGDEKLEGDVNLGYEEEEENGNERRRVMVIVGEEGNSSHSILCVVIVVQVCGLGKHLRRQVLVLRNLSRPQKQLLCLSLSLKS